MPTVTYAECHIYYPYAKCRYAECRYAECRGTPTRGPYSAPIQKDSRLIASVAKRIFPGAKHASLSRHSVKDDRKVL